MFLVLKVMSFFVPSCVAVTDVTVFHCKTQQKTITNAVSELLRVDIDRITTLSNRFPLNI